MASASSWSSDPMTVAICPSWGSEPSGRRQLDAEERAAGEVVQLRGEGPLTRVRFQRAEELEPIARWTVALHARRHADEFRFRTERGVELVRTERAGVQRARDEFPERIEVGERRARGIVMMRRAVVDVRGNPHDVADAPRLEMTQQIGDLQLAAERHARIAVRDRLVQIRTVADDERER